MACPRSRERNTTQPAVLKKTVNLRSTQQKFVKIHREFSHDRRAFTQGLLWFDDRLYESTGIRGESSLRELDARTGQEIRRVELPLSLFGEGLARVGNRLIQLTWQKGVAIVWSLGAFTKIKEFRYEGEGWGLCHNGKALFMSDGTNMLQRRDPGDFRVLQRIKVHKGDGGSIGRINELECVGNRVYANVWRSAEILEIDSKTGFVVSTIDAGSLVKKVALGRADVLNGIAYLPLKKRFLLTGKLWPLFFEVTFEASP